MDILLWDDYALRMLHSEYQLTDAEQVLAVATMYAMEFWSDWVAEAKVLEAGLHM